MSIANNIKIKRGELGYTLEEIAKKLGTSRQTVHRYETGVISNIPSDKVELLAKILEVTPAYLMGWDDADKPAERAPGINARGQKKVLQDGHTAGEKLSSVKQGLDVAVPLTSDIDADLCILADGDSMIGAFIRDGDTIFIKRQGSVDQGDVAAIRIEGEVILRRYYRYGDIVVLRPENSSCSDIVLNKQQQCSIEIIGKAVAFQSNIR